VAEDGLDAAEVGAIEHHDAGKRLIMPTPEFLAGRRSVQ
jgi:hypothetical protein